MTDIQVPRGPLRCPFCHEDCAPQGAVVCQVCLGRHHAGCWGEHGACASCGRAERLVPESDLWQRSEADLVAWIHQGRVEEVEAYVRRCWASLEEARERTFEVATERAVERLAEDLAQRRKLQVIGPRAHAAPRLPDPLVLIALALTAATLALLSAASVTAAFPGLALLGLLGWSCRDLEEPPDDAPRAPSGRRARATTNAADGERDAASGSPGRTRARTAC